MKRAIAVVAVLVGTLVVTAPAETKTSERDRQHHIGLGKRPPCEKRVDGVLREIGVGGPASFHNVSCRKAKRVMKRYILRRKLPRGWECRSIPALGKCFLHEPPENPVGIANFNFVPGQRA